MLGSFPVSMCVVILKQEKTSFFFKAMQLVGNIDSELLEKEALFCHLLLYVLSEIPAVCD